MEWFGRMSRACTCAIRCRSLIIGDGSKVVDFGWLTTAILWQALDPDSGDIHVYRQLYQGQQLVSDIGATVKV